MSAASFATSTAPVDGDADVGGVQRRGVVDAVAHVADDVPRLAQGEDDALLLVRLDLGEDVDLRRRAGAAPRRSSRRSSSPGQRPARLRSPTLRATCGGHQAVVAGDDLQRDAEPRELADGLGDARLRRVGEQRGSPRNVMSGSLSLPMPRLAAERRGRRRPGMRRPSR